MGLLLLLKAFNFFNLFILFRPDWASAKGLLADPNFLKHLRDYDKNHIPDSMLRKLKVYIDHPKFYPEIVENVSKVFGILSFVFVMPYFVSIEKIDK